VPGIALPHEIQIDMGASFSVTGFRYLAHQAWQPGRVGDYEFYVSADGVNWGVPVAIGSFPDTNSAPARDVMFPPKTGRYVRFRALTELHDRPLTFLGELNVWRAGTGSNAAPIPNMISPSENITVRAGSAVSLDGSATDPDGNLPLSYRWSAGAGSGVSDRTESSPGIVHFDRAGTFPITFTVTDALGAAAAVTRTVTVVGGQSLPRTGWTLRFVDSQETAAGNYAATNAFDGNSNTIWTTQWQAAQPAHPHEIQIDLGAVRDVVGFRYLPRQDTETAGNIARYEFYVSADGTNWGPAVATGTFADDSSQKEVGFPIKSGRYVRLRALSEVDGLPYTAVAELGILQRQCVTPSVLLSQPRSGYIQRSSTLSLVADACPGGGQGVQFVVDGVPVATDFTAPYSVNAPSLAAAEHVIEASLVDGSGSPIAGAATYDRSTPVGIGDTYVAMGDGITYGLGDDLPTDDNTADGRNRLGGFESVLAEGLTAARGYPVSVINEGIPGGSAFSGSAIIDQTLQTYPNAGFFILMYGHNDVTAGRQSGLGLVPGSPGYTGSFKDYMQRMITAIRNAGRVALLAKHTAVIPVDGPIDSAIQEYNQVIDELAADVNNGIPVPPPDFYTYFRARTGTHYSNAFEPNGLGYAAMGELWRQAIAP
jgi:lysophospholipase L1-like esterase